MGWLHRRLACVPWPPPPKTLTHCIRGTNAGRAGEEDQEAPVADGPGVEAGPWRGPGAGLDDGDYLHPWGAGGPGGYLPLAQRLGAGNCGSPPGGPVGPAGRSPPRQKDQKGSFPAGAKGQGGGTAAAPPGGGPKAEIPKQL